MTSRRCLTLEKDGHHFVFRYCDGREVDLLATFVAMAADPDSEFDWFDAAVLSYQIGQQASEELDPVG
ncbi:hypothetical protein RAS1_11660 [Phycisphaerae bacterium RAS1]|nr:hypothetical protein RAS1_11660 [Phycisphaerae bacterium RAS1]